MLANILSTQHTYFEALAQSWLESGATGFAVWAGGEPKLYWPSHETAVNPSLRESLYVGGFSIGELRVVGRDDQAARSRLRAEAELIAQLIQSSQNLHIVTSELIDTQDQLLAMYDLTEAMRDYLDLNKVLDQLVRESARLVRAEAAFVMVQRHDESWLMKQHPGPVIDLLTLSKMLEIIRDTGQEIIFSEEETAQQRLNVRNLLFVPIKLRDDSLAALGLFNKKNGDFMSPDIKLARAIADQAGARIESAILYRQNLEQAKLQTEMDLAKRVQLNLLPHQLPSVTGIDFCARSQPASQVGGDFYDYLFKEKRPFTFTVGDISGKGLPAAILMAMTRTVIRAKTNDDPIPSPELVLGRTNQELYNDFTDVNMFATVFFGQYEPDTRELIYANAGHSPVIYCPKGGSARLLEADGTPVGILPKSLSRDQRMKFNPGDVLVVATDGLSEAHNTRDEMFGYDRLLALTESLVMRSANEIAAELYEAIQNHSLGRPQDDDQTVMILKGVPA